MTEEKSVYTGLSSADVTELKDIADEIRYLSRKTAEMTYRAGEIMARARDLYRHKGGGFRKWLSVELNGSKSKAYQLIKFYEKSNDQLSSVPPAGHLESLEDLPQKTLFALSADTTPDDVVKDAINRIRSGEAVTATTVKEMVREQNEKDLFGIAGAINACLCKAVIETGEEYVGIYEQYREAVFIDWVTGVVCLDGNHAAHIMNAYETFKTADDDILHGMTVNQLYAASGDVFPVFDVKATRDPNDTSPYDYSHLGLNEKRDIWCLNGTAGGIQCLWMLCLLDVGKSLSQAQKITGKRGLDEWMKRVLGMDNRKVKFLTDFLSENRAIILSSNTHYYSED